MSNVQKQIHPTTMAVINELRQHARTFALHKNLYYQAAHIIEQYAPDVSANTPFIIRPELWETLLQVKGFYFFQPFQNTGEWQVNVTERFVRHERTHRVGTGSARLFPDALRLACEELDH